MPGATTTGAGAAGGGMISRFFSRVAGGGTTPGKVKVTSSISTKDMRKHEPEAPSSSTLRDRVNLYVQRTHADQKPEVQDFVKRQMFFDLKYRCGAQGRCMLGAGACSFPRCFTLRPCIKGGEILAEKVQIEEAITSSSEIPKNIQKLLEKSGTDDNLEATSKSLQEELNKILEKIKEKSAGSTTTSSSSSSSASSEAAKEEKETSNKADDNNNNNNNTEAEGKSREKKPAKILQQREGEVDLMNVTESEIGRIVILSVWNAVTLVNMRRDEEAVDSLLALQRRLPKEHRGALFAAAAGWACFHDLEVRFYRGHLTLYPELAEELADPEIGNRPDNLLKKVIDACEGEPFFIQLCAHEVFGKEISCIIARAQNAQEHQDHVEDPMGTPVVADSIAKYKNDIGGDFWDDFMGLAMMPTMAPSETAKSAEAAAAAAAGTSPASAASGGGGATPRHILDALGRSMLLHHVAAEYGALPEQQAKKRAEDEKKQSDEVQAGAVTEKTPEQKQKEALLDAQQRSIASRMRELIEIVKKATEESAKK